ncbi:MAG TPA: hypothetical protein VID73_00320, partial [Ktedonobacterales bacterium]
MKLPARWRLPWRRAPHAVTAAPILTLVRDWLVADGARIEPGPAGMVRARMPDGASVAYAASATDAPAPDHVRVLAPGAPSRDELLAAIARGAGQALRVPAGAANAAAIARAAITTLDARKHPPTGDPAHQLCAECLEREGRLLILDGGPVRGVRVERHAARASVEAVIALPLRTHRGARDEVARLVVDAATGAALPPLSAALLERAEADLATGASARDGAAVLPAIAAAVERAATAAGRLARLQSLPDYQRRQADVVATQERLLLEAPDDARAILTARQGELNALAIAHGVAVTPRLLTLTPISEPVAQVRASLAGRSVLALWVDLARATVEAPRCANCAARWRIGARCAEGHITCLSCQRVCGHCGARRCSQCAAAELAPCASCAAPTCARCARDTARGRHRRDAAALAVEDLTSASASGMHSVAADGANDLTGNDLDNMTPATWRAFVRWNLERQGYGVLAEAADEDAAEVTFECQTSADGGAGSMLVVTPATGAPLAGGAAILARHLMERHQRRPGMRVMVVTRLEGRHLAAAFAPLPWLTVVDREQLTTEIRRQTEAFGRTRRRAESDTEARAIAAAAVQATLRDALAATADTLTSSPATGSVVGATTAPGTIGRIEQDARLMRQVLLASETLVEEWLGLFGAAPTRTNGLAIERDAATIAPLGARATHLATALREAAGA